ncbi:MAG: ribonuclease D [Motiliproteus sp.]|jgi:ribonuclease D
MTKTPSKKREPPSKEIVASMPLFPGMTLEQIRVPSTRAGFAEALDDLSGCRFVGFDTESKPCFRPGQVSDGPHVIQLTTLKRAYIFQLRHDDCHALVARLLESPSLVKVGFGLKSDRSHLLRKLGIRPRGLLDMNLLFRAEGYRKELGIKAAIALVLGQRFQKSKHISTSNWALAELRTNQLLYAANDAYAALRLLTVMNRSESQLPIQAAGRT